MLCETRSTSSLMRASSRPGSKMIVVSYVFIRFSLLNRVQSESIPTVHGLGQARRGRVVQRARGALQRLLELPPLLRLEGREHVFRQIRRARGRPHADAQARVGVRARRFADRLQPLVSARSPGAAEPEGTQGQVHII